MGDLESVIVDQRQKFSEIDTNLGDLKESMIYFQNKLKEVSQSERVYSQENIKRQLNAKRELSEAKNFIIVY